MPSNCTSPHGTVVHVGPLPSLCRRCLNILGCSNPTCPRATQIGGYDARRGSWSFSLAASQHILNPVWPFNQNNQSVLFRLPSVRGTVQPLSQPTLEHSPHCPWDRPRDRPVSVGRGLLPTWCTRCDSVLVTSPHGGYLLPRGSHPSSLLGLS